jgi:hypothetical protein
MVNTSRLEYLAAELRHIYRNMSSGAYTTEQVAVELSKNIARLEKMIENEKYKNGVR